MELLSIIIGLIIGYIIGQFIKIKKEGDSYRIIFLKDRKEANNGNSK